MSRVGRGAEVAPRRAEKAELAAARLDVVPVREMTFADRAMIARVLPLRRNRDFVLLQVGQLLSALGSETSALAYPLLVLALTGSPVRAGVVGFARIVPYTLLVLPAGIAVDRVDRRRLMLAADTIRLLALGSLAVVIGLGRLTFAQIVVVALVEGAASPFFNIAEIGALRSVVPTAQLPEATSIEQGRLAAVDLAAPPLGGALFGVSRLLPFLVDAVSYSLSLLSLLAMRTPFQEPRASGRSRIRADLAEGFSFLWRHAFLRTCALLFAINNFVFGALFLAFVVIARQQRLRPVEIGLLLSVFGAFGLAGAVAAPRLQRRFPLRTIVTVTLSSEVGMAAFVARPSVYVLLAGVLPNAFLVPTLNSSILTYRIGLVPDRLQGRVNSLARLFAQLGSPLGPLVAGVLLELLSAREAIGVLALAAACQAVAAAASRSIRSAPPLAEVSGRGPARGP